ncbi:hypothetical protein C4569_03480 [Candidatus Parcubacteria bacterium]|nr:MAG: hypothetical protein C4569_03480 [Candidatus Parcubacteria bacterium]
MNRAEKRKKNDSDPEEYDETEPGSKEKLKKTVERLKARLEEAKSRYDEAEEGQKKKIWAGIAGVTLLLAATLGLNKWRRKKKKDEK